MNSKRLLTLLLLCCICLPLAPAAKAQTVNLVRGMAYTITNSVPTEYSYSNFSEGGASYDAEDGKGIAGKLTDGKTATGDQSDSAWYKTFRSRSRYVTFAFESPVSVTGFSAGFYHSAGTAFYAPRYVKLYLSNDGEAWFMAGETSPDFSLSDSPRRYQAALTTDAYAASYVRLEFCCDIFACIDEVEIFGSTTLTGNEKTFTPDPLPEKGYCAQLEGITDIIKMYNGYYPSAQDKAQNTVEELLPYVAYLAQDGTVQDTMFDAVAFVPCVSTNFAYPSGGTLVKTSKYPPAVMSDWIYYTDFLFAEGYDLDALNTAVEQVYSQLGIHGKLPVLLTMPYVGVLTTPFGEADGETLYARTAQERAAIVGWYDRYVTKRFEEASFSHLELVGYYWYGEEVNYTWSRDEKAFTRLATQAIEDGGKTVMFDPFYLSTGFDHWEELGFDGAVMQPNLAFTDSRPYYDPEMIWEFADTIAEYHLGVEIETNEPGFFTNTSTADTAITNYEKYLYAGYKTGYMDALHTFYQGAGPGTLYNFCHADTGTTSGKRLRRLYDITYQFIKNRYENLPPAVELPQEASAVAGERVSIPLSVTDADSFATDVKCEIVSCESGRAVIPPSRNAIRYIPDEGFAGEDTIVFTVTDGQNEPMEYSITVQVTASGEETVPPAPAPSQPPASADSGEPASGEDSSFPYLWVIGGCVLLCGAFVVLIFLRKRKKA